MKNNWLVFTYLVVSVVCTAQNKKEVFSEEHYGGSSNGTSITIQFEKGKDHDHPLFAIWLADETGKYIQTLYASETIGRGVFLHAKRGTGKWMEGEIQRLAALPFWVHQRNVLNEFGSYNPTQNHPILDAYTGATPAASFILHTKSVKQLNGKYKIMLELNQCWDWNAYWTNDKYPTNLDYKSSGQPALVYAADFDTNNPKSQYTLKVIGHSHYSGADGSLDPDVSTLTTALQIAKRITVTVN